MNPLVLSLKTYTSKPNIFFVQVVAELPSGREHEFTSKKRGEGDSDSYLLIHLMFLYLFKRSF